MNRTVKIEGLDCPNCAKTLENKINKLKSIANAKIEFLKGEIIFDCQDEKKAIKDIIKVAKVVEPDAKIIVDSQEKKKSKFNSKLFLDIAILLLGIVIGLCVIFVKMPTWAFWTLFVVSALLLGYKTYYKALRLLLKGVINENLLITISVIGASVVGEHMEGLMVIALYSIGKIFEGLAVDKSRKSIAKLTDMQPEYAVVIENDVERRVKPEEVALGSIIIVKAGEKVALDGKVISGSGSLDLKSLTGESLPVNIKENDEILSGSILLDGVIKVQTTSEYKNSTVKKILNLIENAQEKKSKTETFISKITKWYTLGVIVLALLVWGIVWAVTGNINTAVYRGLIFLVISCPCAFAISVPLSYFSGIGNASKHGILIKGSNYLDICAKLNMVAFDKTGTLTTGNFVVEKVISLCEDKNEEDILYLASLGEQYSIHPLARAIVSSNKRALESINNIQEVAGEGMYFNFKDKEYFIGRRDENILQTVVEVYENDVKLGEIYLSDDIKETSLVACQNLKTLGVKTIMLTGDNKESALKVSQKIGIDETHYRLLPQDKFEFIEKMKNNKKNILGYVGDGINDAPSLTLADVGISMSINGSSSSIEASDIVLVDDNPSKVATAIKISKFTRKIVWENIILSAIVKATFLALGSFGILGMIYAVFADVGVTLIAILNSLRALYYKPKNKNNA